MAEICDLDGDIELGLELGFEAGGLGAAGGGVEFGEYHRGGVEMDGRPLGERSLGFGCGSGRELGSFDLEDAELSGGRGRVGLFAQRALSDAGAGLAGRDELAGKLDEVGRNGDGRPCGLLKDRSMAEGNLVFEVVEGFVVAGLGSVGDAGQGLSDADIFVEADGEAGGQGVGDGLRDGLQIEGGGSRYVPLIAGRLR